MGPNQPKRIREYVSTAFIFILLAGVLGFYYLKYVPEKQTEFNRNAFLELNQIEYALRFQNQAYHDALSNIIHQEKIDTTSLLKFNFRAVYHPHFDKDDIIRPTRFELDRSSKSWQLLFPVYSKQDLIYTLSKNADTLMSGLVSTYKDVFDGYLLIDDEDSVEMGENRKGKIIFQSGDLYMNFLVNPDSLLKKNGGFSLTNLQDVTIEGNPYKLFLYPFELGSQKLILAGLISGSHYREANQKIPFNLFTIFTVLLLLLVIHLPILKIYILGPNERIRETDIRLIIGSYFIAAFFGFFLFTKIFLDKEQSVQNKKNLEILSGKIIHDLYTELDRISRQLSIFDQTLDSLGTYNDADDLLALSGPPKDNSTINDLDNLFKPRIYPYLNNVFWISDTGRWVARWGFKTTLNKSPLIDVKDRLYFKDFKKGEAILIPGLTGPIAIQPTLSKLEGEYVVTVVKKSIVHAYSGKINNKNLEIKPFLIGLSSKMHSVSDVLMLPGYGFSIIDEDGNILYDSKAGRPLLSNIFKEMENPGRIQQSALYRNTRYIENLILRSKNVALLSTPVSGMPYQLIVYYNRFRSDGFEEHLVTLSAGLIGTVICLLIFTILINQWSKIKTRMLESRSHHFEWLHPSAESLKQKYYLQLIRWMLLLLAVYLLAWLVMESLAPRSEFSLLFISLLFPFYIALYYYELRERYYDVQENRTGINWYFSRPSLALRGLLLIIIILINCSTSFVKFSYPLALPVLVTQLVWAAMIALSTYRFRHYLMGAKIQVSPANVDLPIKNEKLKSTYKIPKSYVWAILIGVTLISIIPASGIFWLFFRQETGLYLNADQLTLAKEIDQRSEEINQRISDFKFTLSDPTDQSYISKLKFSHGIYMISGQPFANDSGTRYALLHYPTTEFIQLHDRFFPSDSLVLAWIGSTDAAADSSWYFAEQSTDTPLGPELLYRKRKDAINPNVFRLTTDPSASWNTAGLLNHSFSGTGAAFSIFFIVGICLILTIAYYLTLSLAKRIFLLELQQVVSHINNKNNLAGKYYEQNVNRQEIGLMIFETCQQLDIRSLDPEHSEIPISNPAFPALTDIYHFEKKLPMSMLEARMPWLVETLKPVYRALWKTLSARQKFILFDFAQDGFANYKTGKDLQALVEKGLLFFDDLRLNVMTPSFQEYVLQMKDDPDLNAFLTNATKEDTWKKFKSPLLIILMAVGIFIFVTQDAIYQKLTGLLTTLTSLLPLLSNLFNKPTGKPGEG